MVCGRDVSWDEMEDGKRREGEEIEVDVHESVKKKKIDTTVAGEYASASLIVATDTDTCKLKSARHIR